MTSPIYTALYDAIHSAIESAYYDDTTTIHDYAHVATEAAMKACGPRELVWTGNESDCYMQVTTASCLYCIGVINDGWYAEFELHTEPKPKSLGWHYENATAAKAAAQAHADAAHWANTVIGKR